jgi:hypothetical protein
VLRPRDGRPQGKNRACSLSLRRNRPSRDMGAFLLDAPCSALIVRVNEAERFDLSEAYDGIVVLVSPAAAVGPRASSDWAGCKSAN